jgi:N-acyl homoserine lactone hydrolase
MVRIYALSCGAMEFDRRAFFPDEPSGARLRIPVPAFLIVHPKGRVLFDTGIHCETLRDPVTRLGERTAGFFDLHCGAAEGVVSQLGLLGMRADAVTHVVNSHLHFDHCGCNAWFPQATILVQREEMLAASAAASQHSGRDWDQPLNYELVDGERDLFGDASLLLIPTPGHTQGHQSLCANAGPGSSFCLTGDACYTEQHLEQSLLPAAGAVWNAAEMRHSLAMLRGLRDRKAMTLIYGHDGAQWASLPVAPDPLA